VPSSLIDYRTGYPQAMLGVSAVLLYYANKQKEMGSVPAACTQAVCSTAVQTARAAGAFGAGGGDDLALLRHFNVTCAAVGTTVAYHSSLATTGLQCVGADAFCIGELSFGEMMGESSLCADAIVEYYKNFAIGLLPVAVVLVTNGLLNFVLGLLGRLERHPTVSAELAAVAKKLLCAQFLNTAVIVFVVSSSLINDATVVAGLLPPGNSSSSAQPGGSGAVSDFSIKWYADVGTGVCLTLVLNAVVPKLQQLAAEGPGCCRRLTCRAKRKRTQRELDHSFRATTFQLSTRYAQLLNTVFSVLFFSSGMPVLLIVGWLDLKLLFSFDKWMFYRYYAKPRQYDAHLSLMASGVLPLAAALHLVMACWTYSADFVQSDVHEIFDWLVDAPGSSTEDSLDRRLSLVLTRTACLPTLTLLAALAATQALRYTSTPLVWCARWLPAATACCTKCCRPRQQVAPQVRRPLRPFVRPLWLGFAWETSVLVITEILRAQRPRRPRWRSSPSCGHTGTPMRCCTSRGTISVASVWRSELWIG
jgi:hypothetical protein